MHAIDAYAPAAAALVALALLAWVCTCLARAVIDQRRWSSHRHALDTLRGLSEEDGRG